MSSGHAHSLCVSREDAFVAADHEIVHAGMGKDKSAILSETRKKKQRNLKTKEREEE
jgi:hypothetical protein